MKRCGADGWRRSRCADELEDPKTKAARDSSKNPFFTNRTLSATPVNDETRYYLDEARNGDFEAAYHGLIELPPDLLPDLAEAYRTEDDPQIRALIVEAVWQHRLPTSLDFLALASETHTPKSGSKPSMVS